MKKLGHKILLIFDDSNAKAIIFDYMIRHIKNKKYLSFSGDKILDINYKKVLNVLSFSST